MSGNQDYESDNGHASQSGGNYGGSKKCPSLLDVHIRLTESYLKSIYAGLGCWRHGDQDNRGYKDVVLSSLTSSVAFHETLAREIHELISDIEECKKNNPRQRPGSDLETPDYDTATR